MPVDMSGDHQVANEVHDVSPPGGNSLKGQPQLGKVLRPQTPENILLLL